MLPYHHEWYHNLFDSFIYFVWIGGWPCTGESDGELSTSVSSPDSSQVLDSVGKPEQDSEAPVLPPKPGNLDDKKSKM